MWVLPPSVATAASGSVALFVVTTGGPPHSLRLQGVLGVRLRRSWCRGAIRGRERRRDDDNPGLGCGVPVIPASTTRCCGLWCVYRDMGRELQHWSSMRVNVRAAPVTDFRLTW